MITTVLSTTGSSLISSKTGSGINILFLLSCVVVVIFQISRDAVMFYVSSKSVQGFRHHRGRRIALSYFVYCLLQQLALPSKPLLRKLSPSMEAHLHRYSVFAVFCCSLVVISAIVPCGT